MSKLWLLTFFALASCAGLGEIKPGEKYLSPFAAFTCGPFTLNTKAQAAFGPHGGTVRFVDEVGMLRVDVEEFQPVVDKTMLAASIEPLYQGYLVQSVMPLIKRQIPGASLIKAGLITVNGTRVYQGAVVTPGNSAAISATGRRLDGLRGLIQYTNGQYMFTVTAFGEVWPDRSIEEQVDGVLKDAEKSFKLCSFPT